jgi:hypothetical protein
VRVTTENSTDTSTATDEQETPAPEAEVTNEQEAEAKETTTEDASSEDEALDPKVLRDLLTKTRAEAANYRTRLRETETKLSEAKTPEEFEKALTEEREKNAALERAVLVANVAREFELPQELAELLQGDDDEALKKHAKALQKFVTPNNPESLDGGLNPSGVEEFDPVAEARKARARRY